MENSFNNSYSLPEKKFKGNKKWWLLNEASMKLMVGKIEVSGKENINKIPPNAKVIVMTTHLTDLDMPIVVHAVAKDLDIVEMDMSPHHKLFGKQSEFGTNIGMRAIGMKNFLPIDYDKDDSGKKTSKTFNPDNFDPAVEIMEKGKAILIAAHNPLTESAKNLDNVKGGYGGVYLAGLTGAYILPITVVLDKDAGIYGDGINTLKKKPNASVVIGEPFQFEKIDGIENLSKLIKNRDWRDEDFEEFSRLNKILNEKSKFVIKKMSEQLSK
jgi:1-acyl-sn-glycerol-3-phosphate acyltransferase